MDAPIIMHMVLLALAVLFSGNLEVMGSAPWLTHRPDASRGERLDRGLRTPVPRLLRRLWLGSLNLDDFVFSRKASHLYLGRVTIALD